jgi:adhesin/invasin
VLVGARPTWTTGDSSIAIVGMNGAAVARGPGITTVSVIVGTLVTTSRLVVKQKVAGVVVSSAAGDTAATVNEGGQLQLSAKAVDARGFAITQAGAAWAIDDTNVAQLDAQGVLTGRDAGRSVVSVKIEGASGYLPVSVVTTATALDVVAGANQRVLAGKPVPQPIVVRATNRRGAPAGGKLVTFRLGDGHGSVDPATAVTDVDGRARTKWTLGDYPGRHSLLATVENVDSAIVIVAEADPVAANTRVAAVLEQLRGQAGDTLADSVGIHVTDSTGRALRDVPVRWTAVDGGSVEAISQRTDSLGMAYAKWTLSAKTGTQRVRAQVGAGAGLGIAPVTISAVALAGAADRIAVVSGDNQRATVATALRKPLAMRVLDAQGNGVADVAIVLSPSTGSVPDTTLTTDSLGNASVLWTLGRSAGAHTLGLHVTGIKKLPKITARATPAPAANLSFDDAPAAEKSSRARAKRLFALVTDIYGNPVPDAPVTFSVKAGTVTPGRAITDDNGRVAVRWTLSGAPGEQTLRGSVRGTDVKGAYVTQVGAPPLTTKTKTTAKAGPTKAAPTKAAPKS